MDEQDIPIDIHGHKLLDWLVSRREVKRDWSTKTRIIREKINNAIQDMPEHPEITKLLSGTYINYFHCLKIVEILKETEKDTKNILGWYGSQRMKDWQEITRLYEKDSVYLAEAAHLLMRNVKYDIPDLKQQISKGTHIQEVSIFSLSSLSLSLFFFSFLFFLFFSFLFSFLFFSFFSFLFFNRAFKLFNINEFSKLTNYQIIFHLTFQIKQEILALLKELPGEFAEIAEKAKTLQGARQLYMDFLSFTLEEDCNCLPMLKYIMEHGNVTTYEWTYGEPPCQIEEPQIEIDLDDDQKEDAGEIDFGDVGGTIDFSTADIELAEDLTTGDIDWGNLGTEESQTIDWGVDVNDVATVDIVVEDSGVSGGVAKGTEALTLLYNPKTRAQLIDELYELEGFLKQRLIELESEESSFSINQFSSAPISVQDQSKEQLEVMVSHIRNVIDPLGTNKMQHLFLIYSSPKYVDRLAASLRSKLTVADKFVISQEGVRQRRLEAQQEQQKVHPKLALMIERSKELKVNIEEHISKRYKNRPVNLMALGLSMT
ncbi:CDK5 regulatory subunit-associated protein 3-like [Penaeus monodon]|uniref:CDK5 regulatory subunit-associated protein 3-like n=1 Tax=Penaeus monodon TaxID=6687 RepID=UPI0018A732B0|nr:CDK5 regulatory subunit-associated protein 3-like [Penaeus monodon]